MPVYIRCGATYRRSLVADRARLSLGFAGAPERHALRVLPQSFDSRSVTSTGSPGGRRGDFGRWDWRKLQRRANRARAQASLVWDEWCDRGAEYRDRIRDWNLDQASQSVDQKMRRTQSKWQENNRGFDRWINERGAQLEADLRQRWRIMKNLRQAEEKAGRGPPFDMYSMMLLGSGVGCALQECTMIGAFLTCCGVIRASRRYVVNCVDLNDREKLFRLAPERIKKKSILLFEQLKQEVAVHRKLRSGDMSPVVPQDKAMHASLDYTPESLYDDTMASIVKHPRVLELLGKNVYTVAEPDKVVYRIHEGIAEVYLGWNIAGSDGSAEVQVKSSASIVDFIYIFPKLGGRYGLEYPAFVIRPKGNWSLDAKDLPKDMKQPFGKGNDRLFLNREGIFDYDWTIKDFRHGYEDHPRRKRASWTFWKS